MAAPDRPPPASLDPSKIHTASLQAGGGAPLIAAPEGRRVTELNTTITSYAKEIYEGLVKQNDTRTPKAVEELWLKEQAEQAKIPPEYKDGSELGFREFITMLEAEDALADMKPEAHDFSRPLSNYYISSSHNTYLIGNQLYGEATIDGYRNVLLRGCRCVEIDVWDGDQSDFEESSSSSSSSDEAKDDTRPAKTDSRKDKWKKRLGIGKVKEKAGKAKGNTAPMPPPPAEPAQEPPKESFSKPERWRSNSSRVEPVVFHGYTATKEVPFREVCMAIGEYAFTTSPLPVIVSLEVHTSHEQQEMMVEIMEEAFGDLLFKLPGAGTDIPLPTPGDLLNKILIKVKYSPPKKDAKQAPNAASGTKRVEAVDSETNSESEANEQQTDQGNAPASKICQALSRLGVYTRSFHFHSFDQPEAKIPTHIFSLSENKFKSVHQSDVSSLSKHNRNFLMRCYPKGLRIQSSNLDPAIFWRHGVQMVALNWQNWDASTMMNEAMFAGSGGYVLKPPGYRGNPNESEDTCATKETRYTLNLRIEYFAGQKIPLPEGDEKAKDFHPYVKTELHIETPAQRREELVNTTSKAKDGVIRLRTRTAKGQDPDFKRDTAEFKDVPGIVPELSFVRFKIKDDASFAKDELAAWACIRLDRLRSGYRFVHLFDANGVHTDGAVFVRIQKELRTE